MEQPPSLELPQFTQISLFALQLAQAFTSWRAPGSDEDIFTYFARTPRYTGDEHSLRATLIRERLLPVFHYSSSQIEYESRERFDLALYSQYQNERRCIAVIETKSSSSRNLAAAKRGQRTETPVEQLERYLTQAGLYLGVLTNGDEWHLFDFAIGREPLASFSLIELATLLQNVSTPEAAEERLASNPLLQQALAITFYYLDAQRWQQTDIFRQHLANTAYYHVASLQTLEHTETLVQHIKQVLGSLRDTIHAQFALMQQRHTEYQQLCMLISNTDSRPFKDALSKAIGDIGHFRFGAALWVAEDGALQNSLISLLSELSEQYLFTGDIALFESEYLRRATELLGDYQFSQPELLDKKKKKNPVRTLPPTEGLGELISLLQTHYAYVRSLDEDYALSKKTIEAYQAWKTSTRGVFRTPEEEFCLQTAYIHFVRLFFVRVCEDHALIPRRISNGPFTRFEAYRSELLSGIKDTYIRLLEETYQRARSVYHNFFSRQELYDWFTLDEYSVLSLFDLLNRFDFQGLSADVLGRVYNEGYIETKERSEKGQFYTPPQIVDYILDALGIPGGNEPDEAKARIFLEKSVGDLSCGSGTFLVRAASRKSTILKRLVASDQVSAEYALQLLTDTFLGFDLNPFACYLAEINLLIQCLPFLLNEQGQLCRSINRFHIYCTDALEPTVAEQIQALVNGTATEDLILPEPRPKGMVISDDERTILTIKDAKGLTADLSQVHPGQPGFDYLLGNPPYVSAGESDENLRYRNTIRNFGTYHLLYQRWDLFVPFFERNLQFLRPETGRLGLIISKGIETEGYAERLRQVLSNQYRILEIDFFPGLRLFQDAAIENTVVLVENRLPDEEHEVIRHRHMQSDCTRFEELPPVPQLAANGQIFRWRYDSLLNKQLAEGTIHLCAIVYVGTGIVAQSKESLDPVVDGRRQKLFTLNKVFLPPGSKTRPAEYTDTGVVGDDVDSYYLRRTRYVAYEKYRSQISRPRHPALFRTAEKLLLGETSGGYYDRAGLFANHSVQVVVSWKALEDAGVLEEKGIKAVLRESRQIANPTNGLSGVASLFDLRYLLGIINSRFIRQYIASNLFEGTREGRVYPDIWKRLPIKLASAERQQQVAALVDEVQERYRQLAALPPIAILLSDPSIRYRDPMGYLAQGILTFVGESENTIAEKPMRRGDQLLLRRQPLMYLASTSPELLRYLELYLTQLHPELQGWSWAEARKRIRVPATLELLHTFMAAVDKMTEDERQIRMAIEALQAEIEKLIAAIYSVPADASMLASIRAKLATHENGSLF